MRVIAGEAKGCRLKCPKGMSVRPTADRVREALFSIIGEKVRDASVLDLYAGAGTLGIEALSRGASSAVFVEQSRHTADVLEENLDKCALGRRADVFVGKVRDYLRRECDKRPGFDLIFLDPPYRISNAEVEGALKGLVEGNFLSDGGLVVLERASDAAAVDVAGVQVKSVRTYGDTSLTFFEKRSA